MLKIRTEQLNVLKNYMDLKFEKFMVVYLRNLFEKDCESLGENRLRLLIKKGIEDANTYGIETYSEIAKYMSLFFFLSVDFDKNEKYPWAREKLNRKNISEIEKVQFLMQKTRESIQRSK